MIAEAATDLLFIGCALPLALVIFLIMRARLVVVPNILTRIFGLVMSAAIASTCGRKPGSSSRSRAPPPGRW